jgi:hypothetical protein
MFRHLVLMSVILMTSLYAVDVLKEDFSGATFPPPGWTTSFRTENSDTWYNYQVWGSWDRKTEHGNPYAYGDVSAAVIGFSPPPSAWCAGYSVLNTPFYSLNTGDQLIIDFYGKSIRQHTCDFTVYLKSAESIIWVNNPNIFSSTIQHFILTTNPVTVNADDYHLEFEFYAYATSSGGYSPSFCFGGIDNVVIKKLHNRNSLKAQPTSLGSIKAAYR